MAAVDDLVNGTLTVLIIRGFICVTEKELGIRFTGTNVARLGPEDLLFCAWPYRYATLLLTSFLIFIICFGFESHRSVPGKMVSLAAESWTWYGFVLLVVIFR